jgi:hypothetical protein|tara:strand:+ start:925 stop:3258 length:2334 start_codon:yes stop_codon:yes gene_type:complete
MVFKLSMIIIISPMQGKANEIPISYKDFIDTMGIYVSEIGTASLTGSKYIIHVPLRMEYLEKSVNNLDQQIKEFPEFWNPKVIAITDSAFPSEDGSQPYRYKINEDISMVEIWNEETWSQQSLTDLVYSVSNKIFPKIITPQDWFTLTQSVKLDQIGKWAKLPIQNQSYYRETPDTGANTQEHFQWIVVALRNHRQATDFRTAALDAIDNYHSELVSRLSATTNDLRTLESLYNHDTKITRGLIDGIGTAAKFLFGVATNDDVSSIKESVKLLEKSTLTAVHISEKLESVVKLSALSIAKLTLQHNDLVNTTTKIARELELALDKSKIRDLKVTRAITLEAVRDAKLDITRFMSDTAFIIQDLIRELREADKGTLSPNLLPPHELKGILESRKDSILGKNVKLMEIQDEADLRTLYKLAQTELVYTKTSTFIQISIPLILKDEIVTRYKIFSTQVPISEDSTNRFEVQIPKGVILKTPLNRVILLSEKDLSSCSLVRSHLYCDISYHDYADSKDEECINDLTQKHMKQKSNACGTSLSKDDQAVKMAQLYGEMYIYSGPKGATIYTKCLDWRENDPISNIAGKIRTNLIHLARNGLITIPAECSVETNDFKIYRGISEAISHNISNYKAPIVRNSSSPNMFLNPLWTTLRKNLKEGPQSDNFRMGIIQKELRKNIESGKLSDRNENIFLEDLKQIESLIQQSKNIRQVPLIEGNLLIYINCGLTLLIILGLLIFMCWTRNVKSRINEKVGKLTSLQHPDSTVRENLGVDWALLPTSN